MSIYSIKNLDINPSEIIRIKIEIDTNPPSFATFEYKYRLLPSPYRVRLYDTPSLFAGKIHAVLCRAWKNRVKGRDLYDYIFYLSKQVLVNLKHLQSRLEDSSALEKNEVFTSEILIKMLNKRFEIMDFEQAKQDVFPFIKDPSQLNLWSKEFFIDITSKLKYI